MVAVCRSERLRIRVEPSQAVKYLVDQCGIQRQASRLRDTRLWRLVHEIKHGAAIALAGLFVLGLVGPTLAASSEETREETALQGTNLTLSQAISTAEQQTGGKAFDAGVDVDHGKPRIVVETNGRQGVQTVIVDAQSGQIVGGHAGGEAD